MWLRRRRVTVSAATEPTSMEDLPRLRSIIPVLGVTQILAWGSSYYLLAVLAQPIAGDTGWPLSAMLVSQFGWRNACLIYAVIHLLVLLPLYVFALPKEQKRSTDRSAHPASDSAPADAAPRGSRLLFVLIALVITISSMISALLSVHMLAILQARDIALGAAVALGAIVGPAQVGARAIEMAISRFHHAIWTKLASTLFVATGVGLLWAGFPIIAAALIFYGAGIGIESIARGTLPLVVFGEHRYPSIMGRIAMPSLIMQAASPSIGAILIERMGANGALAVLFAVALVNVGLVIVLFGVMQKQRAAQIC